MRHKRPKPPFVAYVAFVASRSVKNGMSMKTKIKEAATEGDRIVEAYYAMAREARYRANASELINQSRLANELRALFAGAQESSAH